MTISNLLAIILQENWPALNRAAPTAAEWQSVQSEARTNGVEPLVYDLLRQAGHLAQLPVPLVEQLQKESARTAVGNMLRLRALEQVLATLQEQGITPVLLKGIGLLYSVYPRPNMRPMVDLDLLVLPDELQPALESLQAIGYRPVYPEQFAGAYRIVTHHVELRHPQFRQVYLELHHHWLSLPRQMQRASTRELCGRAGMVTVGQAGHQAYILSVEDQLLHLAAHLASHTPSLVRWLWFYDLLRLIRTHQAAIDWDKVLSRAVAYRLVLPLQWVLPLLVQQLHAPIPRPVLDRLSSLPVTRAETGRFAPDSLGGQTRLGDGLQKMRYGSGWRDGARFAWRMLFPEWSYMQGTYPADHAFKLILRYPWRWFSVLHESWLARRNSENQFINGQYSPRSGR